MAATYPMTSHWFLLLLLVSVHVEVEEMQVGELEGYLLEWYSTTRSGEEAFPSEGWISNMPSSAGLLSQVDWELRNISPPI